LTEFHDVLDTVNDLQSTAVVDHTDVSRVEPSLFVNRLACVLGILVVALQSHRSADENLPSRIRLVGGSVLFIRVLATRAHVRL
jgi:hypothetical protein